MRCIIRTAGCRRGRRADGWLDCVRDCCPLVADSRTNEGFIVLIWITI